MKKILRSMLILFVFCLTLTMGDFFGDSVAKAEDETPAKTIEISNAADLANFVNKYGDGDEKANIILKSDIDMAGQTLTSSIGIKSSGNSFEELAFGGTFDGQGYKIKNLNFDFTQTGNYYVGLFGLTDGAVVKNLSIEGNFNFQTKSNSYCYVGSLIAKSSSTKISMVQSSANFVSISTSEVPEGTTAAVTKNAVYDSNMTLGGIVGFATNNTNLTYCTFRPTRGLVVSTAGRLAALTFNKMAGKISYFGGIVGNLSSSQIKFCVAQAIHTAEVSSGFVGKLYFGGVAGKVEQNSSLIVNVALQNTFDIDNAAQESADSVVKMGEVVGIISIVPNSGNISYIKFKQNSSVARFGDDGGYTYQNPKNYDMIVPDSGLNNLESDQVPEYFKYAAQWHPLYGTWDFDNVWYVSSGEIFCQCFNGNFNISFDKSNKVLSLQENSTFVGRYGNSVELRFSFQTVSKGSGENQKTVDMANFYRLSSIGVSNLNGESIIATIWEYEDGTITITNPGENDYFSIEKEVDNEANSTIYVFKIKTINRRTAGTYSIATNAKTFQANFTTKLFKDNVEQEGEKPGYVYSRGSGNTTMESFSIDNMMYDTTYNIVSRVKPKTTSTLAGWYLENANGEDIEITKNRDLSFVFGDGVFTDKLESYNIYARYNYDPRLVTFILDDGIDEIDLDSGSIKVKKNDGAGEEIAVSKDESALKLEIYTKKGYSLNVQTFMQEIIIYKGDDKLDEGFCKFIKDYETENGHYYQFILDMTKLNKTDFNETFTIQPKTVKGQVKNNSWIWWTVGGVGGAVVIAGVIVLIVLLKRRNGGYGGKMKFNKRSIRNSYY